MGGAAKPFVKAIGLAKDQGAIKKVEEQPKVEAQMNNNVAGPAGPTEVEMEQETLRKAKRKGRKYSILTSSTGLESKPTLSTKTLLG
jgi:hypothetical protein